MLKDKNENVILQESEVKPLEYKKRRRRLGDRSDGRKLRTLQPMNRLMPYIMKNRSDAQNTFADKIEVSKADRLCRQFFISSYSSCSLSQNNHTTPRCEQICQRSEDLCKKRDRVCNDDQEGDVT